MEKQIHYSRKFLNKGKGTAFIETDIKASYFGSSSTGYIEANVSISDCSRKITLDFCATKGKGKTVLQKLDLLISELNKFKTKLEEQHGSDSTS